MATTRRFFTFIVAVTLITFGISEPSQSAVIVSDTYSSEFYGSSGGSYETTGDCDPGSVIVGLQGQDVTDWAYAIGLEIICQPLETLQVPGSATDLLHIIAIGGWTDYKATWCANGQGGTGLNLIKLTDGNYVKNLSLECADFPDFSNETSTAYFGDYISGPNDQIYCAPDYWLTGVVIRTGSGIDAIKINCSKINVVSTAPTIASITPWFGPNTGGTNVTINGTNFSAGATVYFGTKQASNVNFVNSGTIVATTPSTTTTDNYVGVTVSNPDSSSVVSGQNFFYSGIPTINTVSPNFGLTVGGTLITVSGASMYLVDPGTSVKIDGVAVPVQNYSSTWFQIFTPAHSAGFVNIEVDTLGGLATKIAGFQYSDQPTITSISPTSGTTAGGTSVTITGTNLSDPTSVTFGGTPATVTSSNSSQITVTTPAKSAGSAAVVVTTAGGSVTSGTNYTYVVPAPTITSISPTSGTTAGGTSVTITGTNLSDSTSVTFGGIDATIVSSSSTQITVTTPAKSAGSAAVVVTTAGGSVTSVSNYTYVVPAPTITSISPSSGTTAGGTSVTITGTNLSDSTSVTFGGTVATVVSSSSTQITVTTPAKSAGSAAVVVITAGGSVTSASNYTYVAPPTVTKLTPNTGPNSGGTLVTITGTNLGIVNSVKFGGVIGELISSSPTQITVRTPKTALKSQTPVVVSTPGGTVSAGNFVFNSSSSPNK